MYENIENQRTRLLAMRCFAISVIITLVINIIYMVTIFAMAKIAGANNKQAWDLLTTNDILKQIYTLSHNPGINDNILKEYDEGQLHHMESKRPVLMIVYRIDCPDCHRAHGPIKNEIEKLPKSLKNDVYWVPSRTMTGKQILNKYNVQFVPTGILIKKNESINKEVLYEIDSKDKDPTKKEIIRNMFKELKDDSNT